MDDLEIPFRSAAQRALVTYRPGKADFFPDHFLAELNVELGRASTATFDAAALEPAAFSAGR